MATARATATAPAPAGAGVRVADGTTALALRPAIAADLDALGVSVTPIAPAGQGRSAIRLPISGDTVRLQPPGGQVDHHGGVRLRAGDRSLDLRRPRVDLGEGTLTARVGDRRLPAMTLRLRGARVSPGDPLVTIRVAAGALTPEAADAIRSRLGVPVARGDGIADLTVRAEG